MKSTVALVAIIAALTTVAGCGDKEPPAGTNAKPAATAPAKPNPPATAMSSAGGRPHENDSDLLLTMK